MATNSISIPVVQINATEQASATVFFPSTNLLVQTASGTTKLGSVILSSIQIIGNVNAVGSSALYYSTLSAAAISALQNA